MQTIENVDLTGAPKREGIGELAFSECHSLKVVRLAPRVTELCTRAFLSCINLEYLDFTQSTGLETLHDVAFRGCYSLTMVKLPNNIKNMRIGAFWACSGLMKVEVNEELVCVFDDAFGECERLETINLKNAKNMTIIGSRAFAKCKSLKTVELSSNVESVGKDAFHGCTALTDLRLDDGLTKIGVWALSECARLREVIVPSSVKRLHRCFGSKSPSQLERIDIRGPANLPLALRLSVYIQEPLPISIWIGCFICIRSIECYHLICYDLIVIRVSFLLDLDAL